MTWDPRKMTYGEQRRAQEATDLCRSCQHREVCPVPTELKRRDGWYLALATCGYYVAEGAVAEPPGVGDDPFAPDASPAADEILDTSTADGDDVLDPLGDVPFALRWRLLWCEVGAACARRSLTNAEPLRHSDERGREALALAQHAERVADRELKAARTALAKYQEQA